MFINLYNKHNFKIDNNNIELLEQVLKLVKEEFNLKENYSIELDILTDAEIKNINKEYRNIDKVTDVLSFSFIENVFDSDDNNVLASRKLNTLHELLGVIYIAYSEIEKFSNKSFEYNLSFLFCHGLLHVLGLDHGPQMSKLEEKIISHFFCFYN